jgi:zinc transporter 5/7
VRIAQLALFNCLVEIFWFYGITFCGPLRSILVFEQSPTVILIAMMSLVNGSGSAAKTRGLICLVVGWFVLFIMDSDASIPTNHGFYCNIHKILLPLNLTAEAHAHQSGLNHVFYHIVNWFGLSDHSVRDFCKKKITTKSISGRSLSLNGCRYLPNGL